MNGDTFDGAQIVAAVRSRASGREAIIAFADSRYIDVLMNWLVGIALCGIDNYLVIALDGELHQFLQEHGVPCVLSETRAGLGALWVRRIEVFAALCAASVDFIHSDVDAVWMRDPRQNYFGRDAELIASQGTVWPPDVHERWGFVLCCGLFQLRSAPQTQQLLAELRQHVIATGDDQVSINRLLADRPMVWEPALHRYSIDGAGKRFMCSRSMMFGRGGDMRVGVLPHHLFQRVPSPGDEAPYVVHPLSRKEPQAKLAEFARCGCLLLRTDWRSVAFDSNSLPRLQVARHE